MTPSLQADYLVVGSGAMGMAFSDVLLTETDATIVMVDRHHQPGGHWNDAYPFVRLHQPSAFYGVNSRHLGSDQIDQTGWNAGLFELATGAEVCAYFDQVMQQQFLPSGRFEYFPMCEYEGEGRFRSHVSGELRHVKARKVVDSTYMNVTVPSIRKPPYEVADAASCVAVNDLPKLANDFERYVVVGAGKTGMDACLFLLKNGVDPEAVSWIMPRDSWMLDRAMIQPRLPSDKAPPVGLAQIIEAVAESKDVADLFERLAETGQLLRFDDAVKPTMYRCATVTRAELEQLRRVKNVIRMGHVERIEAEEIILQGGKAKTSTKTLHIDCTADGLATRPVVPVFDGGQITLQTVRTCQQVFSAAFIAHVESAYDDEGKKNQLCSVVAHPDNDLDFLRTTLENGLNGAQWAADPELTKWLESSRLDGFRDFLRSDENLSPEVEAERKRIEALTPTALTKIQAYLSR